MPCAVCRLPVTVVDLWGEDGTKGAAAGAMALALGGEVGDDARRCGGGGAGSGWTTHSLVVWWCGGQAD